MDCTIRVAKTKALISFTVTAKLICVFVFAFAKTGFLRRGSYGSLAYILKCKSFGTLIKCKFLLIGSNVSIGDITIDKSSSLPRRQHENQIAGAYGCRENVKVAHFLKSQGYKTLHCM